MANWVKILEVRGWNRKAFEAAVYSGLKDKIKLASPQNYMTDKEWEAFGKEAIEEIEKYSESVNGLHRFKCIKCDKGSLILVEKEIKSRTVISTLNKRPDTIGYEYNFKQGSTVYEGGAFSHWECSNCGIQFERYVDFVRCLVPIENGKKNKKKQKNKNKSKTKPVAKRKK
jgi:hypothetical protein